MDKEQELTDPYELWSQKMNLLCQCEGGCSVSERCFYHTDSSVIQYS